MSDAPSCRGKSVLRGSELSITTGHHPVTTMEKVAEEMHSYGNESTELFYVYRCRHCQREESVSQRPTYPACSVCGRRLRAKGICAECTARETS